MTTAILAPTLTPTLTLSSLGATSDTLSVSVTDTLTISGTRSEFSRINVLSDGSPTTLTTSNKGIFYLYVKNIGINSRSVNILSGDYVFSVLSAGEFCFIPMRGDVSIGLQATGGTEVVEYGYWQKLT